MKCKSASQCLKITEKKSYFFSTFQNVIFYLFDIGEQNPTKGGTHEAIDEKVDTGVESYEEMGYRYTNEGPKWNAKATIFDGRADNFEGQQLVNIQQDAKGMTANEENDNGK